MLDIQKEKQGNVVVLSLTGQLDAITATSMREIVDDLIESKTNNIVFDLACSYSFYKSVRVGYGYLFFSILSYNCVLQVYNNPLLAILPEMHNLPQG